MQCKMEVMAKEMQKKPEVFVFAGPNGSGKSTISIMFRPPKMTYINADDIGKATNLDVLEAAQYAEQQRENCLAEGESFCFETVLSTERNLNLLKRAKERGYFIRCDYVVTVDPNINISRVKSRVASGGHDVPTDKVVSRYKKSLDLIKEVIPLCDVCNIYDNSSDKPYRIFKKRKNEFFYCSEPNCWSKKNIEKLTGITGLQKKDLNK